ncbi:MAG: TIGR00725 family protein [Candidatus Eisenbacteria bacterium]
MHKMIGVIGGAEASPDILMLAESVGRLIARTGNILVCGGLGGVMEAAARGAKSEGGTTVGILPGPTGAEANRNIDIAIATNMGHARNAIIAHTCDSLIAVGGRYGTLSEIGFGLALGKKVIGLRSWDCDPGIIPARDPEDAIEKAAGT